MIKDLFFNLKLTCNACGCEIFAGYFCKECAEKMKINDKYCFKCGRSVISEGNICSFCYGKGQFYEKSRSAFLYIEPVSMLIKSMKFNGKKYLADIFGEILAPFVIKEFADADLITYVPMHKKDLRKRGYNQTYLIAKKICLLTGYKFSDVLEKTVRTKKQIKLNKNERLFNLKQAFSVKDKNEIKYKNVLVIDDVLTTGATAEAISERLYRAGAETVYVLTVASVGEREMKRKEEKKNGKKPSFFGKIFKKKCLHKEKNSVK